MLLGSVIRALSYLKAKERRNGSEICKALLQKGLDEIEDVAKRSVSQLELFFISTAGTRCGTF